MERLSIANPFSGSPVYYLPQTESTMKDAARLAADEAASGTVVVAGYQTAGRGRFVTRKWVSDPGEGLLFTLILDQAMLKNRAPLTPLLAGLGVANYVEQSTGKPCLVKWPNDVIVEGGKVSGILCESKGNVVFIGIGINCESLPPGAPQRRRAPDSPGAAQPHSPGAAQPHAALPKVSLAGLGAPKTAPLTILEEVLLSLREAFLSRDPLEKIGEKLFLKGRQVAVLPGTGGGETIHGVLEGLGAGGQLLVRETDSKRLREIYSGELAVPGVR